MTDEVDPAAQAAHAAQYRRVSDHLALVAGKLQRLDKGPPLSALDIAGLFASTAANIMNFEFGRPFAVAFFRDLTTAIEAAADGTERPN